MLRICALLAVVLAGGVGAMAVAAEPEHGSRDQAVAMVKSVEAMFQKEGATATFKAVTARIFNDRDLYPFVYKLDGTDCVAHGANPAMVGKNLIDLKDQDGKLLIRELSDVAKQGSGWVDYKWPNPITKLIEAKSSYVERMGDYFVGVGVYR